jgi:hypothetical protein
MRKLKKFIINNILKVFLNRDRFIFNVEVGSNKNLDGFFVMFSKTLTKNSFRQLKIFSR